MLEPPAVNKQWNMVTAVKTSPAIRESVLSVLANLTDKEAAEEPFDGDFGEEIIKALDNWTKENRVTDDRFDFTE